MAYLEPTEEQEALRASLRSYFADRWPESELRATVDSDSGHPETLWRSMADDLGLHGLAVPEELGGGGFTQADLLVAFEEMGRALVAGPFFASVGLAAPLLLALPDDAARRLLPGIADGTRIATVAAVETPTAWDPEGARTEAVGTGDRVALTGEKLFVLDAQVADVLLVLARGEGGPCVVEVDPGHPAVSVVPMPTIDLTRRQARVVLSSAPGRVLATGADASLAVRRMQDLASVALAAEQVGGAQRVLEMAVDHAQGREQFGRPIGGFQAIKHLLADHLVAVESARAALGSAAAAVAADREVGLAASVAQALCSEVYSAVAEAAIHVHGGIGFTWEHPAHLYYKRAVSSEVLLGRPREHRARIAAHLIDEREAS